MRHLAGRRALQSIAVRTHILQHQPSSFRVCAEMRPSRSMNGTRSPDLDLARVRVSSGIDSRHWDARGAYAVGGGGEVGGVGGVNTSVGTESSVDVVCGIGTVLDVEGACEELELGE